MKSALIIFYRASRVPGFLLEAVHQARAVCGAENVVPIVSPEIAHLVPGGVPALDNPPGFERFKSTFTHRHSTLSPAFIHAAAEKHFQIRHYQKTLGLDRFVMIDADVLWHTPLDQFFDLELADRPECGLAIVPPQKERLHPDAPPIGSAHCLLSRSAELYDRLADFYGEIFSDPALIAKADDFLAGLRRAGAPGGISDMFIVTEFVRARPDCAGWLRSAENNLNASNGYETALGLKRFRFRAGRPELRRKSDHAWEPVSFLHFQGHAKRLMRACRLAGRPGVLAHLLLERLLRRRLGS